jgi:histidine triad (HIT) family protein
MSFDPNCVFCKIAAHQMPASIIYEDRGVMAILDIRPIVPGHTLVLPKGHSRNLFDLDESCGRNLMRAQRLVARALRGTFNADGLTVIQSNERAGGQSIFHYHAHMLPRFVGDGLIKRPEQFARTGDGSNLQNILEKIKTNLVED